MNEEIIEPSEHMLLFLKETFEYIDKRLEQTTLDPTEAYFWMSEFLGGYDDNE